MLNKHGRIEFRLLEGEKRDPSDKLLLRSTTLFEFQTIKEMAPDITLPSDINTALLGEQVLTVVLPLSQINTKSRNGWKYGEGPVHDLLTQINSRRPEGGWGHIPMEAMDTFYGPPSIRWLAAQMDDRGILWGLGLPLTFDSQNYYVKASATNARVGTSLVAWAAVDGKDVKSLDLMTIDMADPARVGVPMTASPVKIMWQMEDGSTSEEDQDASSQDAGTVEDREHATGEAEEQPGDRRKGRTGGDEHESAASGDSGREADEAEESAGLEDEVADEAADEQEETNPAEGGTVEEMQQDSAESTAVAEEKKMDPEELKKQQEAANAAAGNNTADVFRQRDQAQAQVQELAPFKGLFAQVAELFKVPLKESDGGVSQQKVFDTIQAFQGEYSHLVDECIRSVTEQVCKVPSVRPTIQELARARNPYTLAEVTKVVKDIFAQEHIQNQVRLASVSEQGGAHRRVGMSLNSDAEPIFKVPEFSDEEKARLGR